MMIIIVDEETDTKPFKDQQTSHICNTLINTHKSRIMINESIEFMDQFLSLERNNPLSSIIDIQNKISQIMDEQKR